MVCISVTLTSLRPGEKQTELIRKYKLLKCFDLKFGYLLIVSFLTLLNSGMLEFKQLHFTLLIIRTFGM